MCAWEAALPKNWVRSSDRLLASADHQLLFSCPVYGPENVTSGASSDLMKATQTAQAMVKVKHF